MSFADISLGEERALVHPTAVPTVHSRRVFSLLMPRRNVTPHPLIKLLNIDRLALTRGGGRALLNLLGATQHAQ